MLQTSPFLKAVQVISLQQLGKQKEVHSDGIERLILIQFKNRNLQTFHNKSVNVVLFKETYKARVTPPCY